MSGLGRLRHVGTCRVDAGVRAPSFRSNSGPFLSVSFGASGFTITVDPAVMAIALADVFQVTTEGSNNFATGVVERTAAPPDQVINVRIFDSGGNVRPADFILHWYSVAQG